MAKNSSANGRSPVKPINLALQGGGSHGAFTWGVLDRLLEDPRISFEAVTGASAGAMNAVVLADGLARGDRDEARAALRRFWEGVARAARTSPFQRTPVDVWRGVWSLENSPGYIFFDLMTRLASPYDINPMRLNPLRDLLSELIDFERVRGCGPLQVFISATDVATGRARVFGKEELTADHVMASACLPFLYQAVEIDGRAYWDGGYMGNPPLWPLFDHSASNDVVLVQINPFVRDDVPHRAAEIYNRVNEITFNASLMRELRAIDFVTRLLNEGRLEGTGYRPVYIHMIGDEEAMRALGASSKLNAESSFLHLLFTRGRAAAEGFLAQHFDALGAQSSLDIRAVFQGEEDPLDGARITRAARYASAAALRAKASE
jgi:NTE family protein